MPENNISPETSSDVQYSINLREIWLVIRRNNEVIAGIFLLAVCLAMIFLIVSTPLYKAEAVLQINIQKTKVVNIESVVDGLTSDEAQIQSQLDVITSRSLASRVVDNLNLVNDPEFSPKVKKGSLVNLVKGLVHEDKKASDDVEEKEIQEIKSATVSNVLKKLKVARNPRSYTIIVNFISKSPKKAALIANSFVDEYLKGQLAVKFDATKRANSWLTEKLSELQIQVRKSEVQIQEFKEKHGLIETSGRTITDQQLSELNTQLILASTERSQAEARLRGALNDQTSKDILNSKTIQDLSNQETEVLRKKSDLSSQYGSKHPKMINVNSELSDLRNKIKLEVEKIKSSLENEVNIAKAREESLQKSLDELQGKSGLSTKAKIELGELERQRNADKLLYESFLERSKETQGGQGLERPDAFVISEAEAPSAPTYPSKYIVLLLAMFLAAGVSVLVVFTIEHVDNTITSSKQAEEITSIGTIGMIPELKKNTNLISYLIKKPSSVFAESLRATLTALQFFNTGNSSRVIMVTSSVPKEGKSLFLLSFASMSVHSGKKVLVIDGDMKRPTIARFFRREFQFSLSDTLTGKATAEQAICNDESTSIDFIPSSPNTNNSHQLLGSSEMKNLLDEMRTKYDIIIIDTPPVLAVSDCMVLSKIVDTTLFIVRWRKTSREIVKAAIKLLKSFDIKATGVVVTRVDMEKQGQYSYADRGYYYQNYSEYYSG